MFMADFVYCGRCNMDVQVKDVKPHGNYEKRILSCGHTSNKYIANIVEPPVSISDKITASVSRLEQSQRLKVEEKFFNGKPSMHLSADTVEIVINESIVNVNAHDDYTFTRSLSQKEALINKIKELQYEVERSSIDNQEKKKTLLLLERIDYILSSKEYSESVFDKLKRWIVRNKWVLTASSPYIMKIIDLVHDMMKNG